MKLSRDAIQRMVEAGGGSGGGGGLSTAALESMLSGYAQRSWVDKNYLSIEFFSSIFRIHSTEAGGDDDLIEPNGELPEDTSHVNIEAMFGFWTDLYISALGKSPTGQPASLFLSSMGDVSIPSPSNGQVLTYDSASGKWVAVTPASGVDMSQVWAAMAAVDATKKIDNSHLKLDTFNFLNVKEGGTVEKPVTFQDTVTIDGAVTMGSTLAVTGDITMGSKLVATQEWANNTFVMKSWFDQIFQVFNDQTKIAVNGDLPQDKSKMNIQAMFGFWTELYVSALGKSPDGQASLFLSSLGDVSIPSPANGQVLTYDSASGKWVALTPASGVDMSQVWAAMAAADATKKIDNSHLKLDTFFTALTNANNQISITIGGVTKTLTVAYATAAGDAATLGGTAKGDLFTALSSNWTTNLSATIGGTTRDIPSLYADYANQLRYTRTIWGQDFNGTADVTGDLYLDGSNLRLLDSGSSVDCYIVGYRTSNSSKIGVAVEGQSLFEFNDEEFYSSVGIYSAQYVTALSDIRYKEVVNRFRLDVETIASASIIHFRWKDGNDRELHVGGIAQEWQKILPEAVHETKDGKLSLDYGLVGMVSAVSLAHKVAEQQQRIDDLERRLKKLESMFNRLG